MGCLKRGLIAMGVGIMLLTGLSNLWRCQRGMGFQRM